jgi:sialate O-acetylesterase
MKNKLLRVFKILFFSLFFLIVPRLQSLNAAIKLPAIFSDNMVLQQQTNVALWGTATNNTKVIVTTSWVKKSITTMSDENGNWKLKISTPPAGGPFEMTFSDGEVLILKNVLIGEVWLCAGQSNMQMPLKGGYNLPVIGSNDAIATAGNNQIRLFAVPTITSAIPRSDCKGKWQECNSESASHFSAVAFFFGRYINRVLGVPVGLIYAGYGGSVIESWISENGLKPFQVSVPFKSDTTKTDKHSSCAIFNGMVNPVLGFGIKGCIWYQGESNRGNYQKYESFLPAMVKDWRELWGIGDFPFYYAQMHPDSWTNSAAMREAQLKAGKYISNSGMAVLIDLGERNNVHPPYKEPVGLRLAYLALSKTYNMKGFACSGPVMNSMTISNDTINLTFDYAINGLTSFGKELKEFEIAGSDRKFYPAKASISKSGIVLLCSDVKEPVAVRYAFHNFVVGDLYNSEGLPASSFRTDDWEIDSLVE